MSNTYKVTVIVRNLLGGFNLENTQVVAIYAKDMVEAQNKTIDLFDDDIVIRDIEKESEDE